MRSARIQVNETCDWRCPGCGRVRPEERPELVRAAAGRIRRALAAGVEELVLVGGDPLRRADLPALVAAARLGGATTIVVETNAIRATPRVAEALAFAGLDLVRVRLPGVGPDADAVAGMPSALARALRGMRTLAAAGLRLEVGVVAVRATLAHLAELPAALVAAALPVSALVVAVPFAEAPDPAVLAPVAESAAALVGLVEAAAATGLPVRFDPGAALPPCAFEDAGRVASAFALSPGGAERADHVRVTTCDACLVRDRCPGVPAALLARATPLALHAVSSDRTRRRLTRLGTVEEQVARELVTLEVARRPDGTVVPRHLVRIGMRCNQACLFCYTSTHLPDPCDADVRRAIRRAGEAGAVLALSGGEPTLHPRLLEYVRLGREAGARSIELQTNAVRLAEPGRVEALADAGLDVAFVSLHGATAAVSDHVTGAPGTFARTLLGIDRIAASPLALHLNFVFCAPNYPEFPAWVDLVAQRWPRAVACVSFVAASTDLVPRTTALVPALSAVRPALEEGLRRARAAGLAVTGFESMCGLPLCLVPGGPDALLALPALADGADGGEFVKPPACAACRLSARCFGLRRAYAALHGTDEVCPVTD